MSQAKAKNSSNTSPRGYLSWSQMQLWEKDPNLYYQVYFEGLDQFRTKYLTLGKRMATTLENGFDEEHDPLFEMMVVFMPHYPYREFEINAIFEGIPLKGKLDGFGIRCQHCGHWQDMVRLEYEKQQGTIHQGTQSSKRVASKNRVNEQGSSGLANWDEGDLETKQNELQERNDTMEQRQKVFSRNQSQNEQKQNGEKTSTLYSRTSGKNRDGKLERKNNTTGTRKKDNGVKRMARKSFQERQLDVSTLQEERKMFRGTSYQAIRSFPQNAFQSKQRVDALSILPSVCNKCGMEGQLIPEIGEAKTGKKWTQSMVNSTGQLTFYALLVWLKYKKLPKEIFLHWAKTDEDMEGNLKLTGDIKTFKTQRSLKDLILFSKRIKSAWEGICELGKMQK